MELRIEPYTAPERILFNYEELKGMLLQKAEHYAAIVYTEEQIKDAKADRAALNKLKKALNDERLKREREYMAPFSVFKGQIAEIIGIIDKPCVVIDKQVKDYEERQKAEKREQIQAYFDSLEPVEGYEELTLDRIFDNKWLNASASLKSVTESINVTLEQIKNDLAVVRSLPSYAWEAQQTYKKTLSLSMAVSEAYRLQEAAEQKAAWEAEQNKAEVKPIEPPKAYVDDSPSPRICTESASGKTWIGFKALLSFEDAVALKEFFKSRDIAFHSI